MGFQKQPSDGNSVKYSLKNYYLRQWRLLDNVLSNSVNPLHCPDTSEAPGNGYKNELEKNPLPSHRHENQIHPIDLEVLTLYVESLAHLQSLSRIYDVYHIYENVLKGIMALTVLIVYCI